MKYTRSLLVLLCVFATACGTRSGAPGAGGTDGRLDSLTAVRTRGNEPAPARLLFVRDGAVWIADAGGGNPQRLFEGVDPDLAPDGRSVAYTEYDADGGRFIAVYDIAARTSRRLTAVPGANSFGPRWSPDGRRIVCNHFRDGVWCLAVVDAANRGCTVLAPEHGDGRYSPCWTHDGRGIWCQDLDSLYRLDERGSVLSRAAWRALFGPLADSVSLSSAIRLASSPDGTRLAFDADDAEPPFAAVYVLEHGTGRLTRVTGRDVHAMEPCWTAAGDTLYVTGFRITPAVRRRALRDEAVRTDLWAVPASGRGQARRILSDGSAPGVPR